MLTVFTADFAYFLRTLISRLFRLAYIIPQSE
nr:MAG TPA: hypothetical protein [Caudoviricetes sp.]